MQTGKKVEIVSTGDVDETMDAFEDDLRDIITARIKSHERSLQTRIGPSGLGTPCHRRLAYQLAEIPPAANAGDRDEWRPTVGRAVHDFLADMLVAYNAERELEVESGDRRAGPCHEWCSDVWHLDRFVIEKKLVVANIGDQVIDGSVDVYDRLTATVLDWKICGPKALKDYRAHGPGPGYRVQVHTYGRGFAHPKGGLGFEVAHVAIFFLPMNGELRDAHMWHERFDLDVAAKAIRRAREIDAMIREDSAAGELDELLGELKTANDHCTYCPWFNPAHVGPADQSGCPGDKSLYDVPKDDFSDLLGESS